MNRLAALLIALLLAMALPLSGVAPAVAAAPPQRASFSDVEAELMCVACGVPLPLAESPQADRERAHVRVDIAAGMTKAQIENDMVAIYTDRVLAQPKSSGFGIFVYIVPIAIALGGLALVAVLLPRWKRANRAKQAAEAGLADPQAMSASDTARLDEDLARYKV